MADARAHVWIIKRNIKTKLAFRNRHFNPVPYERVVNSSDDALNHVADWFGITRIPEEQRRLT